MKYGFVGERKFGEEKTCREKIVRKKGIVGNERNDQEVRWRRERWMGRKEWLEKRDSCETLEKNGWWRKKGMVERKIGLGKLKKGWPGRKLWLEVLGRSGKKG